MIARGMKMMNPMTIRARRIRIERIWAIGPEALIWTDRPVVDEPRCGLGVVMVEWCVWGDLNEPRL